MSSISNPYWICSPVCHSLKLPMSILKSGGLVGFIRAKVEFQDGSTLLFFRELIDLRLPLRKVMYAYQYQKADSTLIFRYDNTSHHRSVLAFPHHKHLKGGDVTSANVPSLEQVLREIEGIISRE